MHANLLGGGQGLQGTCCKNISTHQPAHHFISFWHEINFMTSLLLVKNKINLSPVKVGLQYTSTCTRNYDDRLHLYSLWHKSTVCRTVDRICGCNTINYNCLVCCYCLPLVIYSLCLLSPMSKTINWEYRDISLNKIWNDITLKIISKNLIKFPI